MAAPATSPHPSRWRLFWSCLPVALGITTVKLALEPLLGFKGLVEFNSDLNVIFTAMVFIMGFILAGTIVDFKEAERLPGEIACQLEIMEDWFVEASVIAERTPGYPAHCPTRRELLEAVRTAVRVPVVASGGAGELRHFAEGLAPGRADAVLAASRFHDGDLTIGDVKTYLAAEGIQVRP